MRLSRVDPDHEEACSRAADGWPQFEDGDGPELHARIADMIANIPA